LSHELRRCVGVPDAPRVPPVLSTVNYAEVEAIITTTTGAGVTTANAQTDGFVVDGTFVPLNQFHFHSPSEHTLNGVHYPLEMHMVHKLFQASATNTTIVPASQSTTPAKLAVIGIMFAFECVRSLSSCHARARMREHPSAFSCALAVTDAAFSPRCSPPCQPHGQRRAVHQPAADRADQRLGQDHGPARLHGAGCRELRRHHHRLRRRPVLQPYQRGVRRHRHHGLLPLCRLTHHPRLHRGNQLVQHGQPALHLLPPAGGLHEHAGQGAGRQLSRRGQPPHPAHQRYVRA
jgi:hypothetical protein